MGILIKVDKINFISFLKGNGEGCGGPCVREKGGVENNKGGVKGKDNGREVRCREGKWGGERRKNGRGMLEEIGVDSW